MRYANWRAAPQGEFVRPEGVDSERARELVEQWIERGVERLSDADTVRLLECYGIEVSPFRLVTDVDAAASAAEEVGFPWC